MRVLCHNNIIIKKYMSLTSDQWYDLGYRMGRVTQISFYLSYLFNYVYGLSHKYSIVCDRFSRLLPLLKSNFDSAICEQYPRPIYTLPGYDDIPIISVFYKINGYVDVEIEYGAKLIKRSRVLDPKTKEIVNDLIMYVKNYMNDVNGLLYKNKHVKIKKTIDIMDQLLQIIST